MQPPRRAKRWPWVVAAVLAVLAVIAVVLVLFLSNRPAAESITELQADLLVPASALPEVDGATVDGPTVGAVEPRTGHTVAAPSECLDLFDPPSAEVAGIGQKDRAGRNLRISLRTVLEQPDLPELVSACGRIKLNFADLSTGIDTVEVLAGPSASDDPRSYLVHRTIDFGTGARRMVMRLGYFRGLFVSVSASYRDESEPTDTDIAEVNRLFDEQIAILRSA